MCQQQSSLCSQIENASIKKNSDDLDPKNLKNFDVVVDKPLERQSQKILPLQNQVTLSGQRSFGKHISYKNGARMRVQWQKQYCDRISEKSQETNLVFDNEDSASPANHNYPGGSQLFDYYTTAKLPTSTSKVSSKIKHPTYRKSFYQTQP